MVWLGRRVVRLIKTIEWFISKDKRNPERKLDQFLLLIKDTDGVYHAFSSHPEENTKDFIKEVLGDK